MPNFSPAGFVDPYELLCSLKGRLHLFTGTGFRVLHLRAPRKSEPNAYIDLRDLTRWPEAQAVLDQVTETAETRAGHAVELGRAYLEMLDPGTAIAPRKVAGDYATRHARVVVGLRCNPWNYLLCPPDTIVITPGQAVLTSPALYHGALNAGETTRIHLIIDVRATVYRTTMPFTSLSEGVATSNIDPERITMPLEDSNVFKEVEAKE